MKNIIFLLFWCVFLSCSGNKNVQCLENKEFKAEFFSNIKYLEKNISVKQDAKFRESVIFISNYAPVSTNRIMNYSRSYPIGIFEEDRKKWIEWYEENKCKNIQFKTSYIIPEVYKK